MFLAGGLSSLAERTQVGYFGLCTYNLVVETTVLPNELLIRDPFRTTAKISHAPRLFFDFGLFAT